MFSSKSYAISHLQYVWAHIYWTFSTFKESFHECSHKLQLKGPANLQLRLQSGAGTHPRSCTTLLLKAACNHTRWAALTESLRSDAKLIQWIIYTRARWLQWFIWRRLFMKHMTLILLSVWGNLQVNVPRTMNKKEERRDNGGAYECRTSDQMGTREPQWNVRATIDLCFTCSPEVSHTLAWLSRRRDGGKKKFKKSRVMVQSVQGS